MKKMRPVRNKLNAADIRRILRLRCSSRTFADIAARLHVTLQAVRYHCVKNGIKKKTA